MKGFFILNEITSFCFTLLSTLTFDFKTKILSGKPSAVYYDNTQVVPTTNLNVILQPNTVWDICINLDTKELVVIKKANYTTNLLKIVEIYLTDTVVYYYASNPTTLKITNYTNQYQLQWLNGYAINDGTVTNSKLTSELQDQINTNGRTNLYCLNDAWVSWLNGEKFPIAFYSDSTTDGVGTTGYVGNLLGEDSVNTNAYPKLLENKLREATNNSVLRVYNAGFSGKTAQFGVDNFETEFTGSAVYKDVKMIGIGFGINDRAIYTTEKEFRTGFKATIKTIIEKCFSNNIQPFLLTTQAVVAPGVMEGSETQYPMRTAMHIQTIANEVKKELAKEYHLELIDINRYTDNFMKNSETSLVSIIPDKLHFGNVGHIYESGLLAAVINPQTIWVETGYQLDLSNQKIISQIPEDKLTMPSVSIDSFKVYANYTKQTNTDILIAKFYLFVNSKKKMNMRAFKSDSSSETYVKVDGIKHILTSLEISLTTVDLGLHVVEIYSGTSNKVDIKGINLITPIEN